MTNTIKAGQIQEQKPPISKAESRRRVAAVGFARASVGLEGFNPSKAIEADAQQFIAGRSTLAEFVQMKPGSGDK